jgi:hypothetical protein
MLEASHEGIDSSPTACLRSVLFQPFPKGHIQSGAARTRDQPSLLNQVLISAEGYILH